MKREFPAELPHELRSYLAEVKGLQAYYSRELAKLRLTYQVAEHDLNERDTGYPEEPIVPDGERLVYGGREFLVRSSGVTEMREPTRAELEAEAQQRAIEDAERKAHWDRVRQRAEAGDPEAKLGLECLERGHEHFQDLERMFLTLAPGPERQVRQKGIW